MADQWKKAVVFPEQTLREVIEVIDRCGIQIALVVTPENKLLGTVTDGDIRRAILRGVSMTDAVEPVMNSKPTVARVGEPRSHLLHLIKEKKIKHIPVLDETDHLVDVETLEHLLFQEEKPNWVILMAGGQGMRLRPLTESCPKPLLKVGAKPLLETTVENFINYGFKNIFVSVHYKAQMIEDHFEQGQKVGGKIQYLREDQPLGTAGALSLLEEKPSHPFFVMNGDLLTKVNFQQMLDFHEDNGFSATMGVREYDFQIPYGVVSLAGHQILQVQEKPVQRCFVNAGVYILSPSVLSRIPKQSYFDMPSLFNLLIESGQAVGAFPIREYWIDIGKMTDFEKANNEFVGMFQ